VRWTDEQVEQWMGRVLQIGVALAALIVFIGGVVYLVHQAGERPDYGNFHDVVPWLKTASGTTGGDRWARARADSTGRADDDRDAGDESRVCRVRVCAGTGLAVYGRELSDTGDSGVFAFSGALILQRSPRFGCNWQGAYSGPRNLRYMPLL
jgi:hypothetical protein